MALTRKLLFAATASGLIFAGAVQAATITDSGTVTLSGQGFGKFDNILTLSTQGSNTAVSGSVLWNGASVQLTGDGSGPTNLPNPKSYAWKVTDITPDPNTLAIIFNVDEAGSGSPATDVVLRSLVMTFFNPDGTTLLTAPFSPAGDLPKTFAQEGGGIGGSGHVFNVNLSPAEVALVLAVPDARMGLAASIGDVSNGPETFYVASRAVIPLPAAAPAALALLGGYTLTRRRQQPSIEM